MQRLNIYHFGFSNITIWIYLFCSLCFTKLKSQNKDTSAHQLKEVVILQSKQELLQASKKTTQIDSFTLARYSTNSIAELLSNQSTIHIKSYGNGNIATTSIRGGNSNHTAILWNGLNVQNQQLGQADLSIMPSILFENISIEYGGGSGMWGSGAIGGSIRLQNKVQFNQGFKTKIQMSIGSFDTRKIATALVLSYKKIAANTRIYYNSSENNYNYIDATDKEHPNKQIQHANYITKGLLQEISFLVSNSQKINIRAWYNNTFRNLPSYSSLVSKQHQVDENLKLSADWNYSKQKLNSTIRLAYFNDAINYTDSIANLYSKSKVKTIIVESDNIYSYKNHIFNIGVNFTSYKSETENYNNNHQLNKLAFFAAYKLSLLNSKFNYNISLRKEITNQTIIPLVGNTGIHYILFKHLATKINANKSYRQPTLNDLYWNPGGNTQLKPEESYEIDGGLEWSLSKNNFLLQIEATYFNRHTTNWIIWLPTEKSFWSPKNIAEVYSRGTETKSELAYHKNQFLVKLIINTSYVLSTNQKATSENDNSVGRQLIYTPRYNGQASLLFKVKNINLLLNQNYTGYRFTSTDNTSWLMPYYTTNIKIAYTYSFSSVNMEMFGSINNVFNKNYMVISNRPMPLRNFEIGLTMNYHKVKTKNQSLN